MNKHFLQNQVQFPFLCCKLKIDFILQKEATQSGHETNIHIPKHLQQIFETIKLLSALTPFTLMYILIMIIMNLFNDKIMIKDCLT